MHRSSIASLFDKLSKSVLVGGIMLFVVMLILGGIIFGGDEPAEETKIFAAWIGIVSIGLGLTSFVFTGVSIVISIRRLSKDVHTDFLEEKDKEMEYARFALSKSETVSAYVEKVLQNKISRIESRISGFMGKTDLALISLATMGWAFYKEVDDRIGADYVISQVSQGWNAGWLFNGLFFGSAFIFGMTIGAIALKYISKQYRYALEILQLSSILRQASESAGGS